MNDPYLQIKGKQLADRMSFLQKFYFQAGQIGPTESGHFENSIEETVRIHFESNTAQRKVEFILGWDRNFFIGMVVHNTENPIVQIRREKFIPSFGLRHWGLENNLSDTGFELSNQAEGESFELFLERYALTIEALCERELHDILTGKSWQNVPSYWDS